MPGLPACNCCLATVTDIKCDYEKDMEKEMKISAAAGNLKTVSSDLSCFRLSENLFSDFGDMISYV